MVTEVSDRFIYVSGERRRETSRSFRLRFRLYAIRGGSGKISLQRSLACRIGCNSCSFCFKCGIRGLYVVEKMILFVMRLCCWCCSLYKRSSLDSAAALRRPFLIKPSLYPRLRNRTVSSLQWCLKSVIEEHMRRIRRARL